MAGYMPARVRNCQPATISSFSKNKKKHRFGINRLFNRWRLRHRSLLRFDHCQRFRQSFWFRSYCQAQSTPGIFVLPILRG